MQLRPVGIIIFRDYIPAGRFIMPKREDRALKDVEYILEFAAHLGRRMLVCGANLERVDDTMNRVCLSYHLTDISIHSLSTLIQISAKGADGEYAARQVSVPGMDIHLEKLGKLNQLSRTVCSTTPVPSSLEYMLNEAEQVEDYPKWLVLLGRLLSMGCICILFGGTLGDIIAVDLIIFCLSWMLEAMTKANLNHVILNFLSMLFAGSAGLLLYGIGLANQYFVVIITCSMLSIPGIPMVNAARNLFCGNEMNGILGLLNVVIETIAIVMGLFASIAIFGRGIIW